MASGGKSTIEDSAQTEALSFVRNRVRELRLVRAGDLVPNPKNWRRHPRAQHAALRSLIVELGYVDALLVSELETRRCFRARPTRRPHRRRDGGPARQRSLRDRFARPHSNRTQGEGQAKRCAIPRPRGSADVGLRAGRRRPMLGLRLGSRSPAAVAGASAVGRSGSAGRRTGGVGAALRPPSTVAGSGRVRA